MVCVLMSVFRNFAYIGSVTTTAVTQSMKRNLICFSASRDTSITGLSCADTEEESDQETDESSDDRIDENNNRSTSRSWNNYADNENGNETIQTKWPNIFQISDYILPK